MIGNLDPIALWGAVLSTALAIREILKAKIRLEVGFTFTGDIDGLGNRIFLRNLSEKPVVITWWQLQWCKKKRFRLELIDEIDPDASFTDIIIPPHSSYTFTFSGENYFDSSNKLYEGGAIVLYLLISGRTQPVKLKVIESATKNAPLITTLGTILRKEKL
jgi:hypothetical protein